jgi:hypothetical protein
MRIQQVAVTLKKQQSEQQISTGSLLVGSSY